VHWRRYDAPSPRAPDGSMALLARC
jgi:hypothetical protein